MFLLSNVSLVSNKITHYPLFRTQNINVSSLEEFRCMILNFDWTPLYSHMTADEAFNFFLKHFTMFYSKAFPYRVTKKPKKARKPCMTSRILKMISKKNNLYQKFLHSCEHPDFVAFKKFRNNLNGTLRKSKKGYHIRLFSGISDQKVLWNRLNMLLKSERTCSPASFTIDSISYVGKDLTDKFNDYFASLVQSEHDPSTLDYVKNRAQDTMALIECDSDEALAAFRRMKIRKCADAFGLTMRPVLHVLDVICPFLTDIYNLSLSTGTFPSEMKKVKVIILHKGGAKEILGNYRPISILPIFSKGLERVIYVCISKFF